MYTIERVGNLIEINRVDLLPYNDDSFYNGYKSRDTDGMPVGLGAFSKVFLIDMEAINNSGNSAAPNAKGGGGHGLSTSQSAFEKISKVNDVYSLAYNTTKGMTGSAIIAGNKLSGAKNLMAGIKLVKNIPALPVIGNLFDAIDIGGEFSKGNIGMGVAKSSIFILKNTIRFSSPIGFAIITAIDIGVSIYDLTKED